MITNIFEKTRPLNYLILAIALLVCFCLYFYSNGLLNDGWSSLGYGALYFVISVSSLALINFITLKNTLTKNNNFSVLLFFLFILFSPKIFSNGEILLSNFFLLLALRRLISLKSMKEPKEKLFDASFWIFIAALFHFWSIVYILLVFISIILHVSRDFKNWLIPFIALFSVVVLFFGVNLYFDKSLTQYLFAQSYLSFDFTYFETVYQNIALALFASISLLFFISMILTINTKALNLQSSYKKVLFSFVLGVTIYILSANKDNSCLMFCFAPLAIMGGNFIEGLQNKLLKEIVLDVIILLGVFFFVMSL
ncbi:DUF6427 family protein [Flavobacterium okayamense]|nr:DUF6427 family protein [Flavobacterium okayamense]